MACVNKTKEWQRLQALSLVDTSLLMSLLSERLCQQGPGVAASFKLLVVLIQAILVPLPCQRLAKGVFCSYDYLGQGTCGNAELDCQTT